jgi:hypothetical protein
MDQPTNELPESVTISPESHSENSGAEPPPLYRRVLWQRKIGPAFWTIASLISLTVNIILFVILIILGQELFALKNLISEQLVGGLKSNFVLMDQARIITDIQVNDTIPVQFDLPVSTNTVVELTEKTRVNGARVNLSTGGLTITGAPANIVLPKGTKLPVSMNIVVPVDTTVPVELNVPVDIPLAETELHEPFVGLQEVLSPYEMMLTQSANAWEETALCDDWRGWWCSWIFPDEQVQAEK